MNGLIYPRRFEEVLSVDVDRAVADGDLQSLGEWLAMAIRYRESCTGVDLAKVKQAAKELDDMADVVPEELVEVFHRVRCDLHALAERLGGG